MALSACGPKEEDYTAKIAAIRAAKDDSFKNDPDSPVPADKKATLLPLAYFPIDESYAVPASLEPAPERTRIQVPTSIGQDPRPRARRHAEVLAEGPVAEADARSVEVESPQANRLFVPFADLTSGTETYPAGRYMELDPTPTGIYVVDFNIAYHPYCYYSPGVRLPVPAEGEPARGADSRRREDAKGRLEHSMIRDQGSGSGIRDDHDLHAIVFDFDGVIADSERLHLRSYQDILAPEGITMSNEDYFNRYLGYDDVGRVQGGWARSGRGDGRCIASRS